jgi:hypothetical protein
MERIVRQQGNKDPKLAMQAASPKKVHLLSKSHFVSGH